MGNLDLTALDGLSNGNKSIVSQTLVANYPKDADGTAVEYTTLSAVKTAIASIIAGL